MKIENCSCPGYYQLGQKSGSSQSTYQRFTAINSSSDIAITTLEGDTVTFSREFFAVSAMNKSPESSENPARNLASASLQSENMFFEIQGDLNEEELADIKHLFQDLHKIAEDFFRGDIEGAIKNALKIDKNMGSISEVNATFNQTSISAFSRSYEYTPELQAELAKSFMEMKENEKIEETIDQILSSQWQQIVEMLESYAEGESGPPPRKLSIENQFTEVPVTQDAETDEPENSPTAQIPVPTEAAAQEDTTTSRSAFLKHAEKMAEAFTKVVDKHPRLSPFALPLADLAIKLAADSIPPKESINRPDPTELRMDLLGEYNNLLKG